MKGWKTWASAIGMTVLGIVDIFEGQIEMGIGKIVVAFGLVGIGHKVEKAK